jgi:hypothetical protein
MSAAATAAGYLYASGRLRGRAAREQEQSQPQPEKKPEKPAAQDRVRVAVLAPREEKPRRTPKIEYRTRRRFTPE